MATGTHPPAPTGEQTEPMNVLGERLRGLRLQRELTLAQVASAMQVTKPHISSIEKGVHRPSTRLLAKLEDYYDLPPGELFPYIGQQRLLALAAPTPRETAQVKREPDIGGIVAYRDGLTTNALATIIHDTNDAIDILDIWLAENIRRLEGPFLEAASRGVCMRIILVHPDLAAQRMVQMGGRVNSDEIVTENIRALQIWYPKMLKRWEHHWQGRPESEARERGQPLQVRVLPVMPVMQYHRYDLRAFVGFLLHVEQTRESPQIEVQLRRQDVDYAVRTPFGRSFWDEFIYFWQVLQEDAARDAVVPLSAHPAPWSPPALATLQGAITTIMQGFQVRPHDEA